MGTYSQGVLDFQRHMKRLVKDGFPSAFGGECQIGHHLLRRLNHPAQVNDPHIIVPVTAKQHDELHSNPPTIELEELLMDKDNNIIGALFNYRGKSFKWLNKDWVEVWEGLDTRQNAN